MWFVSGRYMYIGSYSGSYFNWTSGPVKNMTLAAATSGAIVANVSGSYEVVAEVTFEGTGAQPVSGVLSIFKNGAAYPSTTGVDPQQDCVASDGGTGTTKALDRTIVTLNPGDRVDARYYDYKVTDGKVRINGQKLTVKRIGD
jgi:hypothetical protein